MPENLIVQGWEKFTRNNKPKQKDDFIHQQTNMGFLLDLN